jgi:hypothetical protein
LLGIRGADQQLTIRLHRKTVIGTASISTTLSGWFVQCNAFRFKEGLQKLQ